MRLTLRCGVQTFLWEGKCGFALQPLGISPSHLGVPRNRPASTLKTYKPPKIVYSPVCATNRQSGSATLDSWLKTKNRWLLEADQHVRATRCKCIIPNMMALRFRWNLLMIELRRLATVPTKQSAGRLHLCREGMHADTGSYASQDRVGGRRACMAGTTLR